MAVGGGLIGAIYVGSIVWTVRALGAGGLATPWYANATAAAGYVFMAFMCIFGGLLVSKIGMTKALLVSTLRAGAFRSRWTYVEHRWCRSRRREMSCLSDLESVRGCMWFTCCG